MNSTNTLLLTRKDVAALLNIEECIAAVEEAFKMYAEGKASAPGVLGVHATDGGFHIKAAILNLREPYFVAKVNANFPNNLKRYSLPTIQGIIVVSNAENGQALALMDSIEITIIRTGAATAVAAKYLSLIDSKTCTICGCGNQGRISLKALMKVRPLEKIYAFDIDAMQVQKFCKDFAHELEIVPTSTKELTTALSQSQICVTCTTSTHPFIQSSDIKPGTFIAAVGADSEGKRELHANLLMKSKIVVDLIEQSARIGELHHVLQEGQITVANVHAELGQVIAQIKTGRESMDEIIVFDSTGTALQDVAAAAIVYEKALANGIGMKMDFSEVGE